MTYNVTRNGQTYGPYTIEDIRRYLATGNVLPTDLATQVEAPPAGAPPAPAISVAQLLGTSAPPPQLHAPIPVYPGQIQPSVALAQSQYPDAPDLHWGLVLLIAVFTNNIFLIVWEFIVAVWLKKVQPDTKTLTQYIVGYSLFFGAFIVFIIAAFSYGMQVAHTPDQSPAVPNAAAILVFVLAFLTGLSGTIVLIIARFTERASLLAHYNGPENVGLRLSAVMTFFFGVLYFQYHLTRINKAKQISRYTLYRPQ